MKILVLNSGSSSQKSCVYDVSAELPSQPPEPLWQGHVDWDGDRAVLEVQTAQGVKVKEQIKTESRKQAVERLLETLLSGETRVVSSPSDIQIAGHRVVNGGRRYDQPTIITSDVKDAIVSMSALAPLHNRAELEGMEIVERMFGAIPQVAVFDTGFHSRLPEASFVYPGPYEWVEKGIRRYGFHGINHRYCAERAAQLLERDMAALKLVTCHLGNGCSLAAIRDGHSVDTTMGFTPIEGLMMGTRSGSVDPGILTYLIRQGGLNGEALDELLNTKSGLLGISGISGDMRKIVAAMNEGNGRSKLAFDIFVHRLCSSIGAMIAVLNGIHALVFTAGIGENSPEVRAAACVNLGFLGLNLDSSKNLDPSLDQDIAAADSSIRVFVIRAQEDWSIARACAQLAATGRRLN